MLNFTVRGLLPMERALQSKRIHNIELPENHDPPRALLRFLDLKTTARKTEIIILMTAKQRQNPQLSVLDPAFLLVVLIAAPVEEHILLA